ncbi:uncharacterized protein LOC118200375 [Stegodyphus dumicola]|uniref:uncharacterized protein LOC118200375 n=1 Tax=Stegodyphus dumicola TaxID=202533 RepID=UPI0015A99EFE|nr:uncharacterized protein LOC118200375 [Stegodyphus dumicola]
MDENIKKALDKAKTKRKTLRRLTTQVINRICELLEQDIVDTKSLEECDMNLQEKADQIFKLDLEIENLIPEVSDLETEVENNQEYRERIIYAKSVIDITEDWELKEVDTANLNKDEEQNHVFSTSQNIHQIKIDDIKFDEATSDSERTDILKLVNEFRDCFALNLSELGCTNVIKMDIKEIDGSRPVSSRPYKTNAAERNAIKEIVKEWKDNGIVSETRSPYASPVLLVKKKNRGIQTSN